MTNYHKLNECLELLAHLERFSGSVLITHQDTMLFQKAYGLANRELNVPLTTDMKFKVASITKMFTATALLQLHEEGKLHLTDTIQKFFPSCSYQPFPTIHQLLSHTAGLLNYKFPLEKEQGR